MYLSQDVRSLELFLEANYVCERERLGKTALEV
jgi:hypothetical protein